MHFTLLLRNNSITVKQHLSKPKSTIHPCQMLTNKWDKWHVRLIHLNHSTLEVTVSLHSIKCQCKLARKTFLSSCPIHRLVSSRFNDMSQMQQTYTRQGPTGSMNEQEPQQPAGGRWDAILADRQNSSYSAGGNNSYPRGGGGGGGGYSGNYNNRNGRDNNGGFGGPRENNYGRRDQESHRPYHSHVGGQSGDAVGADWNTPLPANANLER